MGVFFFYISHMRNLCQWPTTWNVWCTNTGRNYLPYLLQSLLNTRMTTDNIKPYGNVLFLKDFCYDGLYMIVYIVTIHTIFFFMSWKGKRIRSTNTISSKNRNRAEVPNNSNRVPKIVTSGKLCSKWPGKLTPLHSYYTTELSPFCSVTTKVTTLFFFQKIINASDHHFSSLLAILSLKAEGNYSSSCST